MSTLNDNKLKYKEELSVEVLPKYKGIQGRWMQCLFINEQRRFYFLAEESDTAAFTLPRYAVRCCCAIADNVHSTGVLPPHVIKRKLIN